MESSKATRPYGSFPTDRSETPPAPLPPSRKPGLRERLGRFRARTRNLQLVVLGVLITFAALLLANALTSTPPLSVRDVERTVTRVLASATPAPPAAVAVYEQARLSVVQIKTRGTSADGKTKNIEGSGVVLDEAGDILTSLHVVEDAKEILVTFADGTESEASVVASRAESDIAVLRATNPPAILIPAVLGNPGALSIGDEAIVIGNPFGLTRSLTTGVISGLGRSFQPPSRSPLNGLIQFDAAINPGSSGGPLLTRDGDVVGIVTGLVNPTDQGVFIGIGFAVPIDVAAGAAGVPPD